MQLGLRKIRLRESYVDEVRVNAHFITSCRVGVVTGALGISIL